MMNRFYVEPVISPVEDTEWAVKNKLDTVKLLEEDSWSEINVLQKCEIDADRYASSSIEEYYSLIEKYSQEMKNT